MYSEGRAGRKKCRTDTRFGGSAGRLKTGALRRCCGITCWARALLIQAKSSQRMTACRARIFNEGSSVEDVNVDISFVPKVHGNLGSIPCHGQRTDFSASSLSAFATSSLSFASSSCSSSCFFLLLQTAGAPALCETRRANHTINTSVSRHPGEDRRRLPPSSATAFPASQSLCLRGSANPGAHSLQDLA